MVSSKITVSLNYRTMSRPGVYLASPQVLTVRPASRFLISGVKVKINKVQVLTVNRSIWITPKPHRSKQWQWQDQNQNLCILVPREPSLQLLHVGLGIIHPISWSSMQFTPVRVYTVHAIYTLPHVWNINFFCSLTFLEHWQSFHLVLIALPELCSTASVKVLWLRDQELLFSSSC